MPKHVAVLLGGRFDERPAGLGAALRNAGYQVTEIEVDRDIAAKLAALRPDVAFNAFHGTLGEGGMLQGLLEMLEVPYTHSGVLASALALDKHQAKIMFRAAGIPVTDHTTLPRQEAARLHVMQPPYVIKPIAGSSNTLIVTPDMAEPPPELLAESWTGGEEIMVERYIPGRTLACAVMGDVALGVTEINSSEKSAKGGSGHIIPAPIQPKIYDKVQKMALKAHAALGCRGVTRTDFRFNDAAGPDGELVCLALTTLPGMTETSLVPEQAIHAGHTFEELVAWMVEDASCKR